MDFNITTEQQLIVDTVRAFVERELLPEGDLVESKVLPGRQGPTGRRVRSGERQRATASDRIVERVAGAEAHAHGCADLRGAAAAYVDARDGGRVDGHLERASAARTDGVLVG